MTIKVKDSELKAVIAALESDMQAAFETSKTGLLAKADGDDKSPPAEASDDSATPPGDGPPGGDAGGPPSAPTPSPGPDAAASAAPEAGAPAAPGAMPPGGDPAAAGPGAPLTPEALQAEYAQLSPEELDMHLQAAMAAKEAVAAAAQPMGAGGPPAPGGMPAGAPPPGAASPAGPPPPGMGASASPAPAGSPPPPDALKAELSAQTGTGGAPSTVKEATGGKMSKSENDALTQLQADMASMKKSLADKDAALQSAREDVEILTKSVTMVLSRPERKAVTGINYFSKSDAAPEAKKAFTPAEAKAKLAELIPSLSKSERDLVVQFSTGKVGADKIAPILEKYVK